MHRTSKLMSILLILAIFSLVQLSCKKGTVSQDINNCIPENTISYIKINKIYQYKTQLLGNEEDFNKIAEELLNLIVKSLDKHNPETKYHNMAVDFFSFFNDDLLIKILKEQAVIGMVSDEKSVPSPFVLISYSRENTDSFDAFYDNLEDLFEKYSSESIEDEHKNINYRTFIMEIDQELQDPSKNIFEKIHMASIENMIMLSAHKDGFKNLIELLSGQSDDNIYKNPSYQSHMKKGIFYDDSPLEYYYSISNVLKNESSLALNNEKAKAYEAFFRGITSIVDSISVSLDKNTGDLQLKSFILLNEQIKDKKLLSLFKIKPKKFNFLQYVPKESLFIGGYQICNAADVYDYIANDSPLPPEIKENITRYSENIDPKTELILKDDIIDLLGQEMGFALLNYGNFGFLGTEAVLYLQHNSMEKTGKLLDKFEKIASEHQPFKNYNETYNDYEFTVYPLGILSPSLLLTDDFLIIASTRIAVKKVIDTINDKNLNMFKDPVYSENIREMRIDDKANIIYISKNDEILDNFLSTLKTIESFSEKAENHIPSQKSMFELSSSIINYLNVFKSSALKGYLTDDGYMIEAVQKKK